MRFLRLLSLFCLLMSCEEKAAIPKPVPQPEPIRPLVGAHRISSPSAFDISVNDSGDTVMLAWATSRDMGSELRAQFLDSYGGSKTGPVVLDRQPNKTARSVEVGQIAARDVYWTVTEAPDRTTLRHVQRRKREFHGVTIGRIVYASESTRGSLSVANNPWRIAAFERWGKPPRLSFLNDGTLSPVGKSHKGGCVDPVRFLIDSAGAKHFALCTEGITRFFRQSGQDFVKSFAPLREHCQPHRLAQSPDGDLYASATCGQSYRRFKLGQQESTTFQPAKHIPCRSGHPVLGSQAPESKEVVRNAEVFLPVSIAPPKSRAVYTGKAMLVAYPAASDVVVRRLECQNQALVRTDL